MMSGGDAGGQADARLVRMLVRIVLIVVALGAIVGVVWVAGPAARGRGDVTRRRATEASMRMMDSGIKAYKADKGSYPSSLQTLVDEKYFGSVPRDAWDRNMTYLVPGREGKDYSLYSAGVDGVMGTADDLDVWHLGQ